MEGVCLLRVWSLCLIVVLASAEDLKVTVKVGEDATLPCQAEGLRAFEVVEWSRPEPNLVYVLIFHKQNPELEIPEQSYKGRVELKDMNQDVSLVLRNVSSKDRGTYECYVMRETKREKRAFKPVSTIYLDIAPPPSPGGMDGSREDGEEEGGGKQDGSAFGRGHIMAACAVMLVLTVMVLMAVMAVISWKKRKNLMSSPSDEAEKTEMI